MSSHVDRSQALKQEHMDSHVEDLKHRSAHFDPSVLQPNVHNALNLPLPKMNNQSALPNRSPSILYSGEKPYTCESFKSQAIGQDNIKSHEEVLKHRSEQFDPSVLHSNVYNTLYSPTHTEKPFQCKICGESFRSQAMKHYHMQTHVEVPKHGYAQFAPSFPQPYMYNSFNSSLPLMKKQTALYRRSQSSTSTEENPFQCESFRSQAEKQYHMKSHPKVLEEKSAQYDPSVNNSLYSSQQIMKNQTVHPANSTSTHPHCSSHAAHNL